jgi:predicted DNA-binding transcriptional regulator YafY
MDRLDRITRLDRILRNRRTPITRAELQSRFECSRATIQRTIDDARDMLNAPIVYDRERNGYAYAGEQQGVYELPGLWFNVGETYALLTLIELLDAAQPGLLTQTFAPLRSRIEQIAQHHAASGPDFARRIRIIASAPRTIDLDLFRQVAGAVVKRRRLRVLYHGRERDATTERWLSPQRLVHYRSNWYLDAWCHLRKALRSFSLDRLHVVATAEIAAKDVGEARLDAHYAAAYGIFAGPIRHTAVLRFSSAAARWVADEQWHPEQTQRTLPDGGLEMRIPYGDPRELAMEIRKHGPEVEVIGPPALRRLIAGSLRAAAAQYE